MKNILLIDGFSIFFRSFYATAKYGGEGNWIVMKTQDGKPTNAVRVFCNLIINILDQKSPDYMMVVFDSPKKSWRHNYDFYKATRKKQPEELIEQIPLVKDFLNNYGISQSEVPNLEADDVIGILAKCHSKNGYNVEIITGDHDFLQLAEKNIHVTITKKGISNTKTYDHNEVVAEFEGLTPHQLIDLKGLMGDASDNLPGVKGVGKKTAMKLIKEYGSIEVLYKNIDSIKGSLKEKLIIGKEDAYLSKKMGRIMIDGKTEITLNDLSINNFDKNELRSWLQDLELFSIMNKLGV